MQHRWPLAFWAGLGGVLLLLGGTGAALRPVAAQPSPRIEARVLADSVKVGERFTLALVATHAAGRTAIFPAADAGAALFGDVRVVGRGAVQTRTTPGGRQVDSVAYEATTFALDSVRVPVLPVRLATDRDTAVVGSAPRTVPVISVVGPDADGLRTPARLAAFPRPSWGWALLVVLGAAALAGGAYAWWVWRGRAPGEAGADPSPDGPYEAAVARLQGLERRHPTGREACTAFYVDLSDTLRVYMARRMGLHAPERTTAEVVAALRRRPEVGAQAARRLHEVLKQADLVKFAGAHPTPDASASVLSTAQDVLRALEAAQRRADAHSPDADPSFHQSHVHN